MSLVPPGLVIYVINLDRSQDRWLAMVARLETLGLVAIRMSAVDAKTEVDEMRRRRGFPAPEGDRIFQMNAEGRRYLIGEEACFQSHLKAQALFLQTGEQVALILEDDAEMAPDFAETIRSIVAAAPLWDAVRLESAGRRGTRRALKIADLPGGRMLVGSLRPCSGSSGYLITRWGAERFIAAAKGVFEPVDTYLSSVGKHGLRMLDCAPSPLRQSGAASVIHAERDAGAATPTRRAPGLVARWRRLKADLKRVLPRRRLFARAYRGRNLGWIEAPWNRDW